VQWALEPIWTSHRREKILAHHVIKKKEIISSHEIKLIRGYSRLPKTANPG
jgi:hypothetical protein